MKKLDYNRILNILGIIGVILFFIFVIIDYIKFNSIANIQGFYILALIRSVELLIPGIILIYLYNQNTLLSEVHYTVDSKKLKENTKYKIAHISDFHNTNSKRIHESIIKKLEKNKPDIIVITGDLLDSRRTNFETAEKFLKRIIHIAPVYYTLGNHEARIQNIYEFEEKVQKIGVNILRNKRIQIRDKDNIIELIGMDDHAFYINLRYLDYKEEQVSKKLKKLIEQNNNFKILLTHRPELIEVYLTANIDLVLTGHAHGGQIRIPFIGGIIAPGQGFFPKYTKGIHEKNDAKEVISRGIGNSLFPFRINNRPELVFVSLVKKQN